MNTEAQAKQLKKKPNIENAQWLPLNSDPSPDQPMFQIIRSSSHPGLAAIHILLKIIVVASFLLLPFIFKSLTALMIVVIGSAVDFWIVKNLSGRLLVGLRWWVDFQEDGEQIWKFECKVNEKDNNPASEKVFWWSLILFSIIWVVLAAINVLRLDLTNLTICIFCAAMLIFNLFSYYKCSQAQSQNVKKLAMQYGQQAVGKFMSGSIVAKYF